MSVQAREPEVIYVAEDYVIVQDPPSGAVRRRSDEATRESLCEQAIAWAQEYESRPQGLQPSEAARPARRNYSLGRGAALLQSLARSGMPVVGALASPEPIVNDNIQRDVLAPEPVVSSPEGNEHSGLGRATRRSGVEVESGFGDSTPPDIAQTLGPDLAEGSAFGLVEGSALDRPEAGVPSLEQSPKPLGATESALALPDEDQDMSINDDPFVSCPAPSGPEVEDEISRRLLEDRRAFVAANGVPRVVLILCSLFWKLEILKICDLLFGPEAPPNDDRFCRQVAEKLYQNCCRPRNWLLNLK